MNYEEPVLEPRTGIQGGDVETIRAGHRVYGSVGPYAEFRKEGVGSSTVIDRDFGIALAGDEESTRAVWAVLDSQPFNIRY